MLHKLVQEAGFLPSTPVQGFYRHDDAENIKLEKECEDEIIHAREAFNKARDREEDAVWTRFRHRIRYLLLFFSCMVMIFLQLRDGSIYEDFKERSLTVFTFAASKGSSYNSQEAKAYLDK